MPRDHPTSVSICGLKKSVQLLRDLHDPIAAGIFGTKVFSSLCHVCIGFDLPLSPHTVSATARASAGQGHQAEAWRHSRPDPRPGADWDSRVLLSHEGRRQADAHDLGRARRLTIGIIDQAHLPHRLPCCFASPFTACRCSLRAKTARRSESCSITLSHISPRRSPQSHC